MDSNRHALMRGNDVNFELDSETYPVQNNQQDFYQPHSLQ